MGTYGTNKSSDTLLNCQDAALTLGVSVKTIRNWAQTGKIKGIKVGTRGDWRFTKEELTNMVTISPDKLEQIQKIIDAHAEEIHSLATQKHKHLIPADRFEQSLNKHRPEHIESIRQLARHLQSQEAGKAYFNTLGEKLARLAHSDGLTLEEATNGIIFVKQAIWEILEDEGLLHSLSARDFYTLNQTFATLTDILMAKIAFVYHESFEAAEETQYNLAAIVNSSEDAIISKSLDGTVKSWNKAAENLLGYTANEMVGQSIKVIIPEKLIDEERHILSQIKKRRPIKHFETRRLTKDGSLINVSLSVSPIIDKQGNIIGAAKIMRDISSRKQAEEELIESEERFRNLADTAPMYLAMADETGSAVYFNKPWLEFTGKTMQDMEGLGWLSTLHPEDAPKFEKEFKHAFEKQIPINRQYRFRRHDGEYRWMLAVGSPRLTADGTFKGYYGTYTDFHDLKLAQLAVQESEERFRTVANNISQLVWATDKDGNAMWFNQRWYDYTGLSFEDSQEYGWEKVHHPKHLNRVLKKFKESLQSGEIWEDTFPIKDNEGKYRWFLSRAIPIRDKAGSIIQWFGTNTDIDDLRRARQRKTELEHITKALEDQREQLLALNQAKDEFISLASHQLRTPATGVKQFLGMVLEGYAGELSDAQHKFLTTAYDSNERQLKIVNDLLKVARVDSGKMRLQKEEIDIVPLIQDVLDEQASSFLRKQQVHFLHNTDSIVASIDSALLRMAIENLVDNAHKYTYPGKRIEVSVKYIPNGVRITVKDQGTGIHASDMDKLFLKFSRIDNPLSAAAGGSGLGLYWVKRVIELHNGTLEVASEAEKGSAFTINLPK